MIALIAPSDFLAVYFCLSVCDYFQMSQSSSAVISGMLRKFSGHMFGGSTFKTVYVELLHDGTFRWFSSKANGMPKCSINLKTVNAYLGIGAKCESIPGHPKNVPKSAFLCMLGIPHENKKTTRMTFFLCQDEAEMKKWENAILSVLPVTQSSTLPTTPGNFTSTRRSTLPDLAGTVLSFPNSTATLPLPESRPYSLYNFTPPPPTIPSNCGIFQPNPYENMIPSPYIPHSYSTLPPPQTASRPIGFLLDESPSGQNNWPSNVNSGTNESCPYPTQGPPTMPMPQKW